MPTKKADASSTRVIWRYQPRRAADFIVIKSEVFASLQVLFDVPTASDSLHHGGQGCIRWGPDQEIGQLVRVVEAATHHEPVATIPGTSMHHGQASPVKEALAFGPQALGETLPIPRAEGLLGNAGHIREQEACPCVHTDHLDGGDGKPRKPGPGPPGRRADRDCALRSVSATTQRMGRRASWARSIICWPSSGLVAKRTASGI